MAPRSWGRRRGVFVELAGGMIASSILIGMLFPLAASLVGVPARHALQTRFWLACLATGMLLGAVNWLLARRVIGDRLRVLSDRMAHVGAELRVASLHGDFTAGPPQALRLPVDSSDDLGRTAAAFNDLLSAVETEHRFRSLVEATSDVICLIDPSGTVMFVSGSVRSVLGWPPERFVGRTVTELVHPDDTEAALALTLPGALTASGEAAPSDTETTTLRVRHAEHGWRRLEVSVSDRRDDPEIAALVLTGRDVTDRYVLQRRLAHQALHDGLTGLPNRAALVEAGEALLAAAGGGDHALSVVLMDLDRFKEVNDTLGHSYGDRLLTHVATRLQGLLRTGDLLARLGGDEFAVLMPGLDRDAAPAAARRLLEAFVEPFTIDGLDLDVQASIGVAVADHGPPAGEGGVDALLREADIAMYTAKEIQTGVEIYDPQADTHTRSRLVLLSELRRGMAEGQIVLHYQPKIALDTGQLVGVEALVRWQHPTRGLLLPEHFLPVVEQTGLITTLSDIVLDMALKQTSSWLRDGHAVQVAVNLSARYLHHLDLPDRVFEALARHNVPARLLRLELTESALIADPAKALSILERLHDGGVSLSIDDFGTGYSSMSYLKRLPVDELKVDRSFVGGMITSAEDAALVRSVVDLGHNLGMEVVAEGVEDPLTTTALAELKCDVGQGFHFAHPAPASEIGVWLQRASSAGHAIVAEQAVDREVAPSPVQEGGAT